MTLLLLCWVGSLLLLGLRSRVRNLGYWPATGVFNTTVWTLQQTVQTAMQTMITGSLFVVPFSCLGNRFSCVCVWDSSFHANCIFSWIQTTTQHVGGNMEGGRTEQWMVLCTQNWDC